MKSAWKVVVVLAAFVGVGWLTTRLVIEHAVAAGAYEPEVRLAGMMAGLFAGGAAATLTILAVVWKRKDKS